MWVHALTPHTQTHTPPHNTHSMSTCHGTYVDHTLHERKILAFLAGGGAQAPGPLTEMMSVYSRSLPLLSFLPVHHRGVTLAEREGVGFVEEEMTLRRMVLEEQELVWGIHGPGHCPRESPALTLILCRMPSSWDRAWGGQPRPGPPLLR